jgi:hypothetical protein
MTDPRTDRVPGDDPDVDDAADGEEVEPLEGLLDPEEGTNTPASDADAPAPPG